MIAFRGLRVGSVALATLAPPEASPRRCLDIVKRRRRPPETAKSDPSGGLAGPSDVVARPL